MAQGSGKRHIQDKESLTLFDAISRPVWLFDVERHSIWWANKAAVKFWRAESLEELLSRDYSSDSETVRVRLRQVIDHTPEGEYASETWTLYPMGHPVTVVLNMSPVLVCQEKRDAVLIEASAPVHMEEDPQGLRMLESMRYTALIVSSFTLAGEFLSQNPAAAEAYGYVAGLERGDFIERFVDPEEGRVLLAAARAGTESSGEFRVRTNEGTRWHSVDITLGRDPWSGEVTMVVTEEDITKSREAQMQLAELNRTLERRVQERTLDLERAIRQADQANQAKSDFIAHMSHDLRTPLNAILGFSDIIRTGILGENIDRDRDYANSIHKAATQLLGLIDNLLDISRLESGRMVVQAQKVEIEPLIKEVCGVVCTSLKGPKPTCEAVVAEDCAEFATDPRILHQVLMNLLTNAAKYTPAEGAVRISATASADGDGLKLTVADTGVGIPENMLNRIFNAYDRGAPEVASLSEGSGLGLAIVRGLVELLDGEIDIASQEGVGTTVILTIPQAKLTAGSQLAAVS